MQHKLENEVLTIFLEGEINSSNCEKLEECVEILLSKAAVQQLVFDCKKLTYMSSAGFRVILRIKKKIDNTKLIKVCDDVYQVLDMVGFRKAMTVEKA